MNGEKKKEKQKFVHYFNVEFGSKAYMNNRRYT